MDPARAAVGHSGVYIGYSQVGLEGWKEKERMSGRARDGDEQGVC